MRDYVGMCSQEEIKEVEALSKRKYEDLVSISEVRKGYSYKLKGTPFKEMTCTVTEIDGERTVVYELRVGEGDLGKVIGKRGQTAKSIRILIAAASAKRGKRAVLEILE